jgi:DnaJ-domain-containing protein 1
VAGGAALFHALDLLHRPMLAAAMRAQPVPDGVLMLVRIAGDEAEAVTEATAIVPESPARVREAAVLYLQHILLAGADHYRALGVDRDAPQERLREHFAALMKWLHPDRARSPWEATFAERVLAAWDVLKSPERRAAYDRTLPPEVRSSSPARRPKVFRPAQRMPWIRQPRMTDAARLWPGLAAVGAVVALAAIALSYH